MVERSVRLESIHIKTTGIDLSGTSGLRVTTVPAAGSNTAPVDIIDVQFPANSGPVTQIDAAGNDQVELAPYLFDGSNLTVNAHLQGTLPTQPWSAEVEACIHVKAKVDAIKAAKQ